MPTAKKASSIGGPAGCVGPNCDWAGTGKGLQCVDGTGGCASACLCEAEESSFHDKNLEEATRKINRILARIPADPKGRKLSFCDTHMGTFLAWVKHSGKAPGRKAVTRNDDDAKVAKALKLKVKKLKAKK